MNTLAFGGLNTSKLSTPAAGNIVTKSLFVIYNGNARSFYIISQTSVTLNQPFGW